MGTERSDVSLVSTKGGFGDFDRQAGPIKDVKVCKAAVIGGDVVVGICSDVWAIRTGLTSTSVTGGRSGQMASRGRTRIERQPLGSVRDLPKDRASSTGVDTAKPIRTVQGRLTALVFKARGGGRARIISGATGGLKAFPVLSLRPGLTTKELDRGFNQVVYCLGLLTTGLVLVTAGQRKLEAFRPSLSCSAQGGLDGSRHRGTEKGTRTAPHVVCLSLLSAVKGDGTHLGRPSVGPCGRVRTQHELR